jgi:hypothetical protein
MGWLPVKIKGNEVKGLSADPDLQKSVCRNQENELNMMNETASSLFLRQRNVHVMTDIALFIMSVGDLPLMFTNATYM